ncbi:sulfatase family protein [Pararhodonellum marinum]|uniref:sulfatase family protein n=1 Tax=Pararhodonellum marinum TaxID=2755358 RepID=UPI00189002F5|nr:sulfatase [Pararhodonellum marinum]
MKNPKPIFLCLILVISLAWNPVLSQESQAPNILVFVADDAGWRDFGCYGNDAIQTPNVDALATGGLKMQSAFLTTPQCSPSRTSILAGEFAHTLRTEDLHTPLPAGKAIVPTYLKKQGYFSGMLMKNHLGPDGLKQFDFYDASRDESQLPELKEFLDRSAEKPFFLWYAFGDPHRAYFEGAFTPPNDPERVKVPPYLADTETTRKDLAMYYDEISRMDKNIGEAIAELKRRNLYQNTLIIFISDNGMPFTRAKGTLYDEGIRTPLIFHWPQKLQAGVSDELVSVLHLAPTILDLAGATIPKSMYGKSLKGLLEGKEFEGDRYVFSERNWHDCDEHMRSVRTNKYKLIKNAYIEWPYGTAADLAGSPSHQELLRLKKEGKLSFPQSLVFDVPRPVIELYDVENDPFELDNLAYDVSYRNVVQELHQVLVEWMEATDDFPPELRRRQDNTDRVTGTHFDTRTLPPAYSNQ